MVLRGHYQFSSFEVWWIHLKLLALILRNNCVNILTRKNQCNANLKQIIFIPLNFSLTSKLELTWNFYVTLSLKCTVQIARDEQLWFAFFSFQNIKRRNFLSHVVAYIFGQVCQKPNQYKTLLWNCCSTQPLHFQFPRAAEMN